MPRRGPDPRTVWIRRLVALGGALAVVLVCALVVRGCQAAREESAVKDYAGDLGALTAESRRGATGVVALLTDPGRRGPTELLTDVNGAAVQAGQLVDRARAIEPPGRMAVAHEWAVEALEFRRDGVETIAAALPSALDDARRRDAAARIAGATQGLLAGDVLLQRRARPAARRAVAGEEYGAELDLAGGSSLPDLEWLRPTAVDGRLARVRRARGGAAARPPAPGLHGTGLAGVTLGGQELSAEAPARIPLGGERSARVRVENQGENPEREVAVRLRIAGAGEPIEFERAVARLEPGATEAVTIPLAGPPPPGRPVTVSVAVEPVPGERKADNNRASFRAVFLR